MTERSRKGLVAFLILLSVAIAGMIAWTSYQTSKTLSESSGHLEHTYGIIIELERLRVLATNTEYAHHSYLTTGSAEFLPPDSTDFSGIKHSLSVIRTMVADNPGRNSALDSVEMTITSRLAYYNSAAPDPAYFQDVRHEAMLSQNSSRWLDSLQYYVTQMEKGEQSLLYDRISELKTDSRNVIGINALSAFFLFLLLFVLFMVVSRQIQAPQAVAPEKPIVVAFRIAGIYAVLGGLWISFSDRIVASLVSEPGLLTTIQTLKGWAFVLISGMILFVLIRQGLRNIHSSEQRFRNLVEQASDGIFIATFDGDITTVNSRFCELVGYGEQDVLRMNIQSLMKNGRKPENPQTLDELSTGKALFFIRDLIRSDGTLLPVEISARGTGEGRMQGIVRDISERRAAQERLERQTERLRLLNTMHRAILSARSVEEIASGCLRAIRQLIPCDIATIFMCNRSSHMTTLFASDHQGATAISEGTTFPTPPHLVERLERNEILRFDGLPDGMSDPIQLLYDEGNRTFMIVPLIVRNELLGCLVMASRQLPVFQQEHDEIALEVANEIAIAIQQARLYAQSQHQARELEERVTERTKQLEVTNSELEAFAYSVSHDLRAPLRSIDGFSQALAEELGNSLNEASRDYLNRVRRSSQRMGALIDDLLKLSRLIRSEMTITRFDLSQLATSIAAEIRNRDPRRTASIVIQPAMVVDADRNLVAILLDNLMSNSWKFTARQPEAVIELGAYTRDNNTVFFVRDNGAGFDMAFADKLFGAFQRLHSSNEFEGTGIGLATVKRIVQRHGGKVWGEGVVDRGATFYFTLS